VKTFSLKTLEQNKMPLTDIQHSTSQELTKNLKEIEISLEKYVSPDNKDGFYRKFVLWVVRTWEDSEFIDEADGGEAEFRVNSTAKGWYRSGFSPSLGSVRQDWRIKPTDKRSSEA
jgi:hypothetical protein